MASSSLAPPAAAMPSVAVAISLSRVCSPEIACGEVMGEKQVAQWVAAVTACDTRLVEELNVSQLGLVDEVLRSLVALLLSASSLQSFPHLLSLDLSGNTVGNEGCALLAESVAALRGRPFGGLRTLDVSGNRIGAAGAAALADSFFPEGTAELTAGGEEYKLVCSDNPVGDLGVESISAVVAKRRCRAGLFLCNVGCTGRGCLALAKCAPWTSTLDIGYNSVPIARLEALIAVSGPQLRSLGLEQMGSVDGRHIAKDLVLEALGDVIATARSGLLQVNLAQNDIQDAGLRLLTDSFSASSAQRLRELDLSQNRLRDGNLLAKLLVGGGERLVTLNLHGNELNDLAVVCLAAGIAFTPTLRKLDLSRNRFGDDGMVALASALSNQCSALAAKSSEKASHSTFSSQVVSMWLEDLAGVSRSRSTSTVCFAGDPDLGLRSLDLAMNMIMDRGACALADAIRGVSTSKRPREDPSNLAFVDLSDNSVGDVGRRALEEAVEESHRRVQHVLDLVSSGQTDGSRFPRPLSVVGLDLDKVDSAIAEQASRCRAQFMAGFPDPLCEGSEQRVAVDPLGALSDCSAVQAKPHMLESPDVSKDMLESLEEHEMMLGSRSAAEGSSDPVARALFRAQFALHRAQTAEARANSDVVLPDEQAHAILVSDALKDQSAEQLELRIDGGSVPVQLPAQVMGANCDTHALQKVSLDSIKQESELLELLRLQSEVAKLRKQVEGSAEIVGAELREEPDSEAPTGRLAISSSARDARDFESATARLECEVAELRAQVARIDRTLASIHPQPEEEVDMDEPLQEVQIAEGVVNPLTGRVRLPKKSSGDLWGDVGPVQSETDIAAAGAREPEPESSSNAEGTLATAEMPSELAELADFVNAPAPQAVVPSSPARPGELETPPVPEQMSSAGPSGPKGDGKGKGKALGPPPPPAKGTGKGPPPPPKAASKAAAPKTANAKSSRATAASEQDSAVAPLGKKLYWKSLDIGNSEGTIFSAEGRERRSSTVSIDTAAFAKMFEAEKEKGQMDRRKSSAMLSKAQKKSDGIKLLSDHRARNIAIILRRLRFSTTELTDILQRLAWESQGLSTDDLEQLLEVIPTKDEGEKLREYRAVEAREKMRDVEQMVLPLALLSRSAARVRLLCIARGSKPTFNSTMQNFAQIRLACSAIQKSSVLQEVMWLALDLGNYINHGDSSKGAKAITVGSLVTLKDFKTGRMSSLHFLCACLMRGAPSRDFQGELVRELKPALSLQNLEVQTLQSQTRNFFRDFEVAKAECSNFLHEYEGGGESPKTSPAGSPRSPSRSKDTFDDDESVEEGEQGSGEHRVKEELDSVRFVEDVMKIRGPPGRRLRNMLRVVEKLSRLLRDDLETTTSQVHKTLRFCGMTKAAAAAAKSSAGHKPIGGQDAPSVALATHIPQDLELLLQQIVEFVQVFKQHWNDVRSDIASYQQFFTEQPSSGST